MKLFESATFKLTAYYLIILMIISIGFSAMLFSISSSEVDRGIQINGVNELPFSINDSAAFEQFRQERVHQANMRIVGNLVVINLVTLLAGGAASYFLARRTLAPIQEAMDVQSRFTSDASHELRTPLTVIQTENEVLLRKKDASKSDMRALLQSNLEEINKLRGLSDRLLQLASDTQVSLQPSSLDDIAIDAVSRVVPAAQAKHMTIENNIGPLQVQANAGSLADLLVILLDNAIKYSPDKSQVTLGSYTKGKYAVIEVKDEGEGIKATQLPHIFDRFYRADSSRTRSGEAPGFGLGLAIARRIVDIHNGEITVESNPGKGTTFRVCIPHTTAT